jgi:hypothetical protein
MKKIYLLPLIALFFTACSVDDSADLLNQENATDVTYSAKEAAATAAGGSTKPGGGDPIIPCFSGLTGYTTINVDGGLNNPVINFVGNAPSTVSSTASYNVWVEVQGLADCEDFNVTSGLPIFFYGSAPFTNVYAVRPVIAVQPNQVPVCYKWRIIFERAYSLTTPCKSISPWYDAPLF